MSLTHMRLGYVEANRSLTLAEQGLAPGDAAFNPIQFKGEYGGYLQFKGEYGGYCLRPGTHVQKVLTSPIPIHTNRFGAFAETTPLGIEEMYDDTGLDIYLGGDTSGVINEGVYDIDTCNAPASAGFTLRIEKA